VSPRRYWFPIFDTLITGRLLNIPMDYSLAFNQALKNVVVALPQRPPHETADDVVRV